MIALRASACLEEEIVEESLPSRVLLWKRANFQYLEDQPQRKVTFNRLDIEIQVYHKKSPNQKQGP